MFFPSYQTSCSAFLHKADERFHEDTTSKGFWQYELKWVWMMYQTTSDNYFPKKFELWTVSICPLLSATDVSLNLFQKLRTLDKSLLKKGQPQRSDLSGQLRVLSCQGPLFDRETLLFKCSSTGKTKNLLSERSECHFWVLLFHTCKTNVCGNVKLFQNMFRTWVITLQGILSDWETF